MHFSTGGLRSVKTLDHDPGQTGSRGRQGSGPVSRLPQALRHPLGFPFISIITDLDGEPMLDRGGDRPSIGGRWLLKRSIGSVDGALPVPLSGGGWEGVRLFDQSHGFNRWNLTIP